MSVRNCCSRLPFHLRPASAISRLGTSGKESKLTQSNHISYATTTPGLAAFHSPSPGRSLISSSSYSSLLVPSSISVNSSAYDAFVGFHPASLFSTCSTKCGLFSQAEKKEANSGAEGSSSEDASSSSSSPSAEETMELLKKTEELLQQVESDNKKLVEERDSLKDKYKRSLAETENVRNRMQKQIGDAKVFGIQGFCKDLLEVADILERAVEATPKDNMDSNQELKDLFDGLTMTESQLLKVFGKHGLTRVNPSDGDKFDPNVHEALFQLPAPDKENNTIAAVTQKGFVLNGRTLRAAKVGVVKNA